MSDREKLEVQLAAALMHEEHGYVDTTSDTYHRCKWRVQVIRSALEAAGMRVVPVKPRSLPELPDDDRDFTPDLARKIIRIYQSMLAAQEDSTSE